jgi:membrane protease YdiL (CAAX protease family)
METDRIQLKTLLSSLGIIFLAETVGGRIGASNHLFAIGFIRILEISCMIAVVFFFEKNLSCIGIHLSGFFGAVKRGVLWTAGFGLLAAGAGLLLFLFGVEPFQLIRVHLPADILSIFLFFSVGGVIAPVAEEIFFRGLIFRFFRPWGFFFSLCFSTVIFAALHPMSSGIPIPQLVGGLLFATAFEFEKNLLVPVMLHVLGNLAIFSLSLLTL